MKLKLGQKILFRKFLVRKRKDGKYYWESVGTEHFKPGIWIGYRTVFDGYYEDYGEDGGQFMFGNPEHVNLVVRDPRQNPLYVRDEDIIPCTTSR